MSETQVDRTRTGNRPTGCEDPWQSGGRFLPSPGRRGRRTLSQWLSPFETYAEWSPMLRKTVRFSFDEGCSATADAEPPDSIDRPELGAVP